MSAEEAVLDYDALNHVILEAERTRGVLQVMDCLDGVYRVEFLIEEKVENFWVRKLKVIAKRGVVNTDLLGLMAYAFKIPMTDFHKQKATTAKSFELHGEA